MWDTFSSLSQDQDKKNKMQKWMTRVVLLTLAILCFTANGNQVFAQQDLRPLVLKSGKRTLKSIKGTRVSLIGDAVLIFSGKSPKIDNGEVHFAQDSLDALVVFERVVPSVVQEKYLSAFFVEDQPAVHGQNVRLVATPAGTLVFPHGPDYAALKTFNSAGLAGESREFVIQKFYKSKELATDEDKIKSFQLKRGYMATLAENEDGSGASKVFVAFRKDLDVKQLPATLKGKVSFVRVFPWRYTGKKGFGGKLETNELLKTQWYYSWNAGGQSSLDIEYVPMRHNGQWPPYRKINELEDVTHVLGFNEPNQKDQANMTVEQAIAQWPKLQASGLRLGSPAPNDAERGLKWLYEFMDEADKRGLRVDFVNVHYYKADWPAKKLIAWLQKIHKRTGNRPIWLTEFNNGAPWTKGHDPTYAENTKRLNEYCKAMDSVDFVERYAIFNSGPSTKQRQLITKGELTPTGEWYKKYVGAEAVKPKGR